MSAWGFFMGCFALMAFGALIAGLGLAAIAGGPN